MLDPLVASLPARLLVAAALVYAVSMACPASASSWSTPRPIHPSNHELDRLRAAEPYIGYFTSLRYGPNGTMVDADYLRALILTESAARSSARSPKGALGLTQIMPHIGRGLAARVAASGVDFEHIDEAKLRNFRSEYLYDSATNILLACHLTAIYTDRYGGRTDLVAAAWNAGPQAVDRYGKRPPPYEETRGLLTRLHRYMTYFRGGRAPMWSVHRWDTYDVSASGWKLDYEAPGWDIGWSKPSKPAPRKF